jgi:hypothetical protein
MILYAYMCAHCILASLRITDLILDYEPLLSEVILSHGSNELTTSWCLLLLWVAGKRARS